MTVKEVLDEFGLPKEYHPTIKMIDFKKLETFVSFIVDSLIAKYNNERVKYEIEMDNPSSPTSVILTYIVEVGGLKIISDNHLETNDLNKLQIIAVVVALALNFSLALELKKRKLYEADTYNYYDLSALDPLIKRLINLVLSGDPESPKSFEAFANEMVKINLFNNL